MLKDKKLEISVSFLEFLLAVRFYVVVFFTLMNALIIVCVYSISVSIRSDIYEYSSKGHHRGALLNRSKVNQVNLRYLRDSIPYTVMNVN